MIWISKLLSVHDLLIKMKHSGKQSGSSLLITILLMGVLMTLTLGISNLVIREIGLTQSIVDANKAFYAAEAGVESALLALQGEFPGYQPAEQPVEFELPLSDELQDYDPNFKYDYSISNTAWAVPDFADDKPIFVANCQITSPSNIFAIAMTRQQLYQDCPKATYRRLALNQTHIIPLFRDNPESAGTIEASEFVVQYYTAAGSGEEFFGDFKSLPLQYFDVLRWKIYGTPKAGEGVRKTDSIADLYPGIEGNSPTNPVCIGTNPSITSPASPSEQCLFAALSPDALNSEGDYLINANVGYDSEGNVNEADKFALWSAARQCYRTEAGDEVTAGAQIKAGQGGCTMRSFIDSHNQNYLVLTNMVNPNIVGIFDTSDPIQLLRADIYYRVLVQQPAGNIDENQAAKLVKDLAEIRANGESAAGRIIKSLDVQYKAPTYLPVFNFSLYKTAESEASAVEFEGQPSI